MSPAKMTHLALLTAAADQGERPITKPQAGQLAAAAEELRDALDSLIDSARTFADADGKDETEEAREGLAPDADTVMFELTQWRDR